MTKFNPEYSKAPLWFPDKETIMAASAAVEALVKWDFCDCGCPQQRSPASKEDVDMLRIAAYIRVELLS